MDQRDLILVALRWVHAAAAAAFVGASAFYLLILGPALRQEGPTAELVRKGADAGYRELVKLSMAVFVITGGLMTFERLSGSAATTTYTVVLGLKILLSVLLFRWAFQLRGHRAWQRREARLLVGSGFLVLLLAALLKTIYEAGLRA